MIPCVSEYRLVQREVNGLSLQPYTGKIAKASDSPQMKIQVIPLGKEPHALKL